MKVLAGVEEIFKKYNDCPGLGERLQAVEEKIKGKKVNFTGWEIELPCEKGLLHPAVVELLDVMVECGATISVKKEKKGREESDLDKVKALLSKSEGSKTEGNKKIQLGGDGSLVIYKFRDRKAAEEYMALKAEEIGADVWVNGDNKSMDNWLRMMGKATTGSSMAKSMPEVLQLLVLGIDMMKEPLNIRSLISWLYTPVQPLGSYFGKRLAEKIIETGGYRNEECTKMVKGYINGDFEYKGEEGEEKEKKGKMEEDKEREERGKNVVTYLPGIEKGEGTDKIKRERIKNYVESLGSWARSRAEYEENEATKRQLGSLSEMCATVLMLIDDVKEKEIESKVVDSWISTLFDGEVFQQYEAQVGSVEMVDSPAKIAGECETTVWMDFKGGEGEHLDCDFLYPSERKKLGKRITTWGKEKEIRYHDIVERTPFMKTSGKLILVTTQYTGGAFTPKHPIMVMLKSQIENLEKIVKKPKIEEKLLTDVKIVDNRNDDAQMVKIDRGGELPWPDHYSPTSMDTLVEHPLDYVMEKMLKIVGRGLGSAKDVRTTRGTVAHAVIEHLFKPQEGAEKSTVERINEDFDSTFEEQVETCGAILNMPENKHEKELLKMQLKRCLGYLTTILRDNKLVVIGCEVEKKEDLGFGEGIKGIIDMMLEDGNGTPVVIDFKWTTSNYYKETLEGNRSIQLELYKKMVEKGGAMQGEVRTGYFLMPEGRLYSLDNFKGDRCVTMVPKKNKGNDVVEQLKNSVEFRKDQIKNGQIETGDGVNISDLPYGKEMEQGKNLYPLKEDKKKKAGNTFSKYGLFKEVKETTETNETTEEE